MSTHTDPHHGHVTVHASAGTGKTWLLVSRLLRLLLDGARPDGILALTFTHKAAAEMQTRLLERLLALVDAPETELDAALRAIGLTPDAALRARARGLYEMLLRSEQPVQTTTFHAFCQQILRRFPLEADVPPGFQLLERTAVLRNEAWEALAVDAARDTEGPLARAMDSLFQRLGLYSTRRALEGFVEHRADWWALTGEHGEGGDAVNHAMAQLATRLQDHFPDLDLAAGEDSLMATALADTAVQQHITELARLLGRNPTATHQKLIEPLHTALDSSREANLRWQALGEALLTRSGTPRKLKAAKGKYTSEQGEAMLAHHAQLVARYLAVSDRLHALRGYRLNCAWMEAGERFLAHFQRLKREQRLLDFTDLEWRTCQLLNDGDNALWVQYKLDARIDHLLIDEFQDTNPTQWRLVLPLLEELAAGESGRARSVFLVGDAKQSIYRFRRAEPRLFDAASQWLRTHLDAGRFPLNRSWRSAPAIMDFVNRVFGHPLFARQLTDFVTHETHLTALPGRVVMLPLAQAGDDERAGAAPESDAPAGLRDPLTTPRARAGGATRRREAEQITAAIRELMATPLIIGADDDARPLRYSDIFILVRHRTHVADFEDALREAHIPYLGADRGTLLEALEIRDMVALLQWLLTPYDNLALAGILRSPLFALGNAQLARVAAAEGGNWFARLGRLAQDAGDDDAVLARAVTQLTDWQALAGHIPVHDLLDRIYSEGNVLARYRAASAAHMQGRVTTNLAHFLELALDMDAGRYPGLMRFLESLREMREHPLEAPDEPPTAGDGERVQILTIHAAKGLEAPVVFLADAATTPRDHSTHATLVDWPVEAPRPSLFMLNGRSEERDSFSRERLGEQQAAEAREEANLLYVALTRARQLLYVSGTRGMRGNYGDSAYARLCTALDLDEDGPPQALTVCENGSFPTPGAMEETGEDAETLNVAEELCHPLSGTDTALDLVTEIAPSRSVVERESDGHAGDDDARLRGTLIHRALELLSGEWRDEDADTLARHLAREHELRADNPLLRDCLAEAQAVIDAPTLAPLFDPDTAARNEVPIYFEDQGRIVHGIIDRLLISDEVVRIIDYKSHRHATPETVAQLAQPYAEQMRWYAEGVRRLWPQKRIEALLLFTACRQSVPVKVD